MREQIRAREHGMNVADMKVKVWGWVGVGAEQWGGKLLRLIQA